MAFCNGLLLEKEASLMVARATLTCGYNTGLFCLLTKGHGVGGVGKWRGSVRNWERGNPEETILHQNFFNKKR